MFQNNFNFNVNQIKNLSFMKKLLSVAMIGVAGIVSAKDISLVERDRIDNECKSENSQKAAIKRLCSFVESDCGEAGLACGESNSEGTLDWEVLDEMRQLLNEAFCGYGD